MRNSLNVSLPKDITSFLSELKKADENRVREIAMQVARIMLVSKILVPGEYFCSVGVDYEITFARNSDAVCLTILNHNTQEAAMEIMECTFATIPSSIELWVSVMLQTYLRDQTKGET